MLSAVEDVPKIERLIASCVHKHQSCGENQVNSLPYLVNEAGKAAHFPPLSVTERHVRRFNPTE